MPTAFTQPPPTPAAPHRLRWALAALLAVWPGACTFGGAAASQAAEVVSEPTTRAADGTGETSSASSGRRRVGAARTGLDFHVLCDASDPDLNEGEFDAMAERLARDGPAGLPGDRLGWFAARSPGVFRGKTRSYEGAEYLLLWLTPGKSLDHSPGRATWALARAWPTVDVTGQTVVGFTLDGVGTKGFGDLTAANVGRQLAIVLDGQVLSAPKINTAITGGSGVISGGGRNGFTTSEVNYLVRSLNAGSAGGKGGGFGPRADGRNGRLFLAGSALAALVALVLGLLVVSNRSAARRRTVPAPADRGEPPGAR